MSSSVSNSVIGTSSIMEVTQHEGAQYYFIILLSFSAEYSKFRNNLYFKDTWHFIVLLCVVVKIHSAWKAVYKTGIMLLYYSFIYLLHISVFTINVL